MEYCYTVGENERALLLLVHELKPFETVSKYRRFPFVNRMDIYISIYIFLLSLSLPLSLSLCLFLLLLLLLSLSLNKGTAMNNNGTCSDLGLVLYRNNHFPSTNLSDIFSSFWRSFFFFTYTPLSEFWFC